MHNYLLSYVLHLQLPLPLEVGHRFWHSVVAIDYSLRLRQLVFFGGCPGTPEDMSGGSWTKLAATVMVELGKLCTSTILLYQ